MRNDKTLTGKIIHIRCNETRYGRRAGAKLESIDWSTGEVSQTEVVAWGDEAYALEQLGLGKGAGLKGYWKKGTDGATASFVAKDVSELRILRPEDVDVSAYL